MNRQNRQPLVKTTSLCLKKQELTQIKSKKNVLRRDIKEIRVLKHLGFLRSRIGAVIISDGLSEQKNRSYIKKKTHSPQRHYSCRTQHLGLILLPFKISSLHKQEAAHTGFIMLCQRHQRQLGL